MYIWKCWRDSRYFFFVVVTITAATLPVATILARGTGVVEPIDSRAAMSTLLGMGTSLGLGALMASEEFAQDTISFLFSRPRKRAYFVWMGWVVGGIELLLIVFVNMCAAWVTLTHFHAAVPGPVSVERIFEALTLFLFVYSLTFTLTAMLGSGLKGLGASMACIFGWSLFALALEVKWKIHCPVPTERLWTLPIAISNAIWIATAMLFVVFAQVALERWEA